MNARTTVSRVVVLTLLLWAACPSPAPPVTTCGRTAQMMDHTFTLEADPAVVDQVEFVRRGLPIAYRAMAQVGPGKWIYRMGFTYGSRGHRIRYWFRVHRKDLGRWIKISDPRARLLDASVERASLFHVRQDKLTPPPPLKKMPRVRDLIIYELCPREFVSSATPYAHPARAPNARGPGKVFKKITKKIRSGYFNRLGVNALQLMPITASGWTTHKRKTPERDPWGYTPISWYALNGDFGTPRDLVELVAAAHERGIAVLLDYSLDHGYGGTRHGKITDLFPAWRNPKPKNPWSLLELNVQRPDLRRFLVGALRRFLVDYGMDGFRMDWTENVPWEVWGGYVKAIKRIKPTAVVITENPVRDLVAKAGFDTAWDFFFQWEAPLLLRRRYTNWDGYHRKRVNTQDKLVENLTSWKSGPHAPPGPLVRYIESHDLPRIARSTIRWQHGGDQLMDLDGDGKTPDLVGHGGLQTSHLGVVLLATVPGAIMLFAGQEHGASDDLFWGYDPLDWRALHQNTLNHYRKLLNLRRQIPDLRSDDLRLLVNDTARHLLIYSRGSDPRRAGDDTVVVALNFGDQQLAGVEVKLPAVGAWRDLLTGKALPAGPKQVLSLPPSGWAVWGR